MLAGTRLYYAFYDSAIPTEEKFMERVDALTREIGDRAKLTTPDKKKAVSEGVPPSTIRHSEPAPAPQAEQAEQAPAPAPAPASEARSALTSAATAPMTPQSSYSPSMQSVQQQPGALMSSAVAVRSDGGGGGSGGATAAAAGSFAV